jgi:deoxyribodipyrimidine photo-lyase
MPNPINIHWFRQDLRVTDNPSLFAAANNGQLLPIYIIDDESAGEFANGAASNWWLHQSLLRLNESLNGNLCIYRGYPKVIIEQLCEANNVASVQWNRCYEPWRIKRDSEVKAELVSLGISVNSFNGSLLSEPWTVTKKDGTPYKIFTPYYRSQTIVSPQQTPDLPESTHYYKPDNPIALASVNSANLVPKISWYKSIQKSFTPGELGAYQSLKQFIVNGLENYQLGRNFPSTNHVSRLSAHLHFGEVSPGQIWREVSLQENSDNTEHFKRELCWREFSYYLLYHWPTMPTENLKSKFRYFPWKSDKNLLSRWQQGQTGYPIVDAGMRELWQTGFMHNRVRMITASFLVKNLLIHWHHGAAWFWDCLVDADLASNSASWQWVAGCGTDASPFFRIFNPITQGEKFDADGEYTKRYIPELSKLPNKYLFKPWLAPKDVLQAAGITLGVDYPQPIVDIQESRQQALEAFQLIKELNAGETSGV